MAFLSPPPPRFLSLPSTITLPLFHSPPPLFQFHRRSSSLFLSSIVKARFKSDDGENISNGPAVLWFKNDLRVDDHPGLVEASKHAFVVPVYVFDHRILSRLSHEMLEVVLLAVEDLRKSLKEQGSNLMIRFGHVEDILWELVKEVEATNIFVEEEVEYGLCSLIDIMKDSLAVDTSLVWKPKVTLWRTPFYDFKDWNDLSMVYKDTMKPRIEDSTLLGIPTLPNCYMELDWGHLPTMDDVLKFIKSHSKEREEEWYSIKNTSAEAVLREDHMKLVNSRGPVVGESRLSQLESNNQYLNQTQRKRLKNSLFGTSKENIVSGGTNAVLNALAAYLRYLEGTGRDDWQE